MQRNQANAAWVCNKKETEQILKEKQGWVTAKQQTTKSRGSIRETLNITENVKIQNKIVGWWVETKM